MNKKYFIIFSLFVSFVVLFPNPIAVVREDNYYFESEEVNITILDKDLLYLEGTYNFSRHLNEYPELLIIDYPFIVVGNEETVQIN
ncbi:hypothetical protein JEZ13_05775 [bacterium]|nr:hypothetical protein [bacterium]